MKLTLIIATALLLGFLAFNTSRPAATTQRNDVSDYMPKSRDLTAAENQELVRLIDKRFGVKVTGETKYHAAGAYRFVGSSEFLYIDRTDVGSVAFERADYGDPQKARSTALSKEALLKRVQMALRGTDLDVPDRRFAQFQDEFAGSAQPAKLKRSFDPRKASKLVARTLNFERMERGVPFFGSEFLIGINPDGNIGRLRKHWPKVDAAVVDRAMELQKAVRAGRWQTPSDLRGDEIQIIEVTPGVGHSSFADPGFRVEAVVRVVFRKTAKGTQYPISSTGYMYFDANGKEVRFTRYPELPGSTRKAQ